MITLKEVTILSDELRECLALDTEINKEQYPNSPASMLATPHIYMQMNKANKCHTYAIYDDGAIVGITQCYQYVEHPTFPIPCYRLYTVLIDLKHRDKNYEETVLRMLLDKLRAIADSKGKRVFITHTKDDERVALLYQKLGFVESDITWSKAQSWCTEVILEMYL